MKKGFTLLELLAVVVVIAIVTLIAIPIIANVIDKAKQGSAMDSAYGYIDTIEKNVALGHMDPNKGIVIPASNTLSMGDEDQLKILDSMSVKGERPSYVEITFDKQKVVTAGLCINGYNLEYKNKKAEIVTDTNNNNDYCTKGKVTGIEIKTSDDYELTQNGDDFILTLSSGKTIGRFFNIITNDGSAYDSYSVTIISNESNAISIDNNKNIIANGVGSATVKVEAGIRTQIVTINSINDSVLGFIQGNKFEASNENCSAAVDAAGNDYVDCQITIAAHGEEYPAHVLNYDSDLTISANTTIGSTDDLGAKMVVLKVNGNLTVDSGATLYPVYNNNGGPKGFTIFVTGTLTNNGVIQNTRGGRGNGQDVHLWKNADTSERDEYETVPAQGSAGGGSVTAGASSSIAGKAGTAGSGRGTGGGGGGAGRTYNNKGTGGPGGRGSSYSGGSGGGGGAGTSSAARTGGTGSSTGAGGGAGNWMGGGAGNPGGGGNGAGGNGTGGLIIIYANHLTNAGSIKAQGTAGGNAGDEKLTGGGGSGGGSINVFYNTTDNIGTTVVTGGNGGTGSSGKPGGKGGNGTATFGSIATGTFVPYS